MATMDATMELFGSAAAPSAPPSDGDDTYDAREREIEGGGGADAPGTLHLAVSRQKMYLYLCHMLRINCFGPTELNASNPYYIGYRSPADRRGAQYSHILPYRCLSNRRQ